MQVMVFLVTFLSTPMVSKAGQVHGTFGVRFFWGKEDGSFVRQACSQHPRDCLRQYGFGLKDGEGEVWAVGDCEEHWVR